MSRVRQLYAFLAKLPSVSRSSKSLTYLPQRRQVASQNVRWLSAFSNSLLSKSNSPLEVVDNQEKGSLELTWSDGEKLEFAKIFLRDHCRCQECFDAKSYNRLLEPYTLPLDVTPTSIQASDQSLEITWSDNHSSSYSFEYLKTVQQGLDHNVRHIEPTLWKVEDLVNGDLPRYDLMEVIEDEGTMWKWFLDLKKLGVTVLTNGGAAPGALNVCKEKIFGGYTKATHYGYVTWIS